MSNILFRCPNTGMNVQHFVAEPSSKKEDAAIMVVNCPACTRIHLVNGATGELARDTRSR
ncbi:hypothetical protein [Bradyrhizobium sp. BR 10289]|uniref:hypothetical protein n=1 Tax=Bradyrhizobium sp. BR 10289 TaxID=2749993 RepID=UPI001C650801|nr:hypothetical protein [Bradyrhizobium sp. BR 10289]MBW7973842.1 hypothetical protein [Bradyrhizobium sp. BR 10289]